MKLWAIIDVGSTSIGGALVRPSKHNTQDCPEILYTTRHRSAFQQNLNLERFLRGMEQQLSKTVADLQTAGFGAPQKIIGFLSSPFYAAETKIVHSNFQKPTAISPQLITKLITEEQGQFKKGQKILESKIINLKLNGYAVDPHQLAKRRLNATSVKIANYFSIASERVVQRFQNLITSLFHQTELEWHSFLFAFFAFLRSISGGSRNFLLFDVGGEITEVAVAWDGVLEESFSYPLGINSLIRRMAEEWGTSPAEARSSLEIYLNGLQHGGAAEKTQSLLAASQEEWLKAFRAAAEEFSAHSFLPENVFLVGEPSLMVLFSAWLKSELLSDLTLGHKQFSPHLLGEDLFTHFCVHRGEVIRDWSLMVETVFCDKMMQV